MKPDHLFMNNRIWARRVTAQDPDFFARLARQQSPEYLWIGCADSRVPANEIVGLYPGEMFVHRNIANVVVHTDLNCLSVLQYAVDVLKVRDIIVCGHYGCGGVQAALNDSKHGLIDNWLRHIQDVVDKHEAQLAAIPDPKARLDRLCELNVIEQVANVSKTTVMSDAWGRGQRVEVHGCIYGLQDGLLQDVDMSVGSEEDLAACYKRAISSLVQRKP